MFKKVLLALALGVSTMLCASAQKAELTLSYGAYTQMDGSDMHDGWHHVNTAWGALNAGLNFKIAPKIWVGPSYTFSSTTTKGGPECSHIAYHAVMMNGRYHYYTNSYVTLYAKFGLGVEFSYMQPYEHDNYTKTYCAFQVVPVGASVDISRSLGMFAELGYGAQGVFQFGVKYRF